MCSVVEFGLDALGIRARFGGLGGSGGRALGLGLSGLGGSGRIKWVVG